MLLTLPVARNDVGPWLTDDRDVHGKKSMISEFIALEGNVGTYAIVTHYDCGSSRSTMNRPFDFLGSIKSR